MKNEQGVTYFIFTITLATIQLAQNYFTFLYQLAIVRKILADSK